MKAGKTLALLAAVLLAGGAAEAPAPDPLAAAFAEGRAALVAGDRPRARTAFEQALALAEAAGDRAARVQALTGLGDSHDPLREPELALGYYRRSLELAEGAERDLVRARVVYTEAIELRSRFRWDEARQRMEQALALARAGGDASLRRRIHISLGHVFMMQGLWDPAEAHYQAAVDLCAPGELSNALVIATEGLGDVADGRGDTARAAELFQKAVDLARPLGNPNILTEALTSLGGVYLDRADYSRAHAFLLQALEARPTNRDQVGAVLGDLGLVAFLQGERELAADYYRRARAIGEELGDRYAVARVIVNQGILLLDQGDHGAALETFREALALAEEVGDRESATGLWRNLGSVYEAQGRLDEARSADQRSVELARELGLKEEIAEGLGSLASLALARGESAAALDLAGQAAALAVEIDRPELFWRCRTVAGRALAALGRDGEARQALDDAIRSVEGVRELSGSLGKDFFAGRLRPYQELLELEARAGNVRAALGAAEAGRARMLLDRLRQGRATRAAEARLPVETPAREDLLREIRPEPGTLVLVFAVLAERTWLFTVSSSGAGQAPSVEVATIPVGRKDLARSVEDLRGRLARRDLGFSALAREIHDLLLGPVQRELRGRRRVVLVPDGPLWGLPFQALQDETGASLLERHALSYAPSLAVLREILGRPPGAAGAVLAVGNPVPAALSPLPEAEGEVRELGRLYRDGGQVLTGTEATERRVKARAGGARVLHFATHGVLANANPLYSHLVLAQSGGKDGEDGLLEAWEILRLRLDADLVVLAACQTAQGSLGEGEGLIGLTWAFLAAGGRSVVASQWEVDSAATRSLMVRFHRRLLSGEARAAALQGAARDLAAQPAYRHPFYWAGFVLVGDGAGPLSSRLASSLSTTGEPGLSRARARSSVSASASRPARASSTARARREPEIPASSFSRADSSERGRIRKRASGAGGAGAVTSPPSPPLRRATTCQISTWPRGRGCGGVHSATSTSPLSSTFW